jgi:hypothetical protein
LSQTSNGDYIAVGRTQTYVDSKPTGDESDALVYKLNAAGQKQWRKHYSHWAHVNSANDVKETSDGGFVFTGITMSWGDPSACLVCKIDTSGNLQWIDAVTDYDWEAGYYIWQTGDGGYFLLGVTDADYQGKWTIDLWACKLDTSGDKQWRKNYGGVGEEWTGRWLLD